MVTPLHLVKAVWKLVERRRPTVRRVLDLGAGDGRFSRTGDYESYTGYELDKHVVSEKLPRNARMFIQDALDCHGRYDLGIGNPPFMRIQDLDPNWRDRARRLIAGRSGVDPGKGCNLYLYFIWLNLLHTRSNGLVVLVVPSDWIYKPSAAPLRRYIKSREWSCETYELPSSLDFGGVRGVNAGITVIDKDSHRACTRHYALAAGRHLRWKRSGASPSPLEYTDGRPPIYAFRGVSPGSRETFVLTEKERLEARISRRQVYKCIPSLRPLPASVRRLTESVFRRVYVEPNRRCWLLRTDITPLPKSVALWLERTPSRIRRNATCKVRPTWYRYTPPTAPSVLYSNAFKGSRKPKIVENSAGVRNLGTVHGVSGHVPGLSRRSLLDFLRRINYERGTVPWSGGLRRVEIGQMNSALGALCARHRDKARGLRGESAGHPHY